MKHKYLSLAVLSLFSGMTMAATSVTLYGTAEIAYRDDTKDNSELRQDAAGESRVGFKGQEDLGNGMAAFFQMESRYNLDTGVNTGTNDNTGFFDEKSVVGLSFANGVHKVYFGKSASPIDRIGNNVGHLANDFGVKTSMGGWRNGAFYDYNANGLAIAVAVTTKGGAHSPNTTVLNEGAKDSKSSYGISARYDAANWYAGAGWQADNDKGAGYNTVATLTTPSKFVATGSGVKNEWLVVGGYKWNPVFFGASYADANMYNDKKRRIIQAHIGGNLTPNDQLFVNYANYRTKTKDVRSEKVQKYGLGYTHSLSKRTSVFAGVARINDGLKDGDADYTDYDIGLKHTF